MITLLFSFLCLVGAIALGFGTWAALWLINLKINKKTFPVKFKSNEAMVWSFFSGPILLALRLTIYLVLGIVSSVLGQFAEVETNTKTKP